MRADWQREIAMGDGREIARREMFSDVQRVVWAGLGVRQAMVNEIDVNRIAGYTQSQEKALGWRVVK
jgi:hypothetical protein